MTEFLRHLFTSDFMPHGQCWRWDPWVVWTNVLSDGLIALTYTIIAFTLLYVAHRRKDVPLDWVIVMFGVFTLACGCTHAMEVYNTWHGVFRLAGAIKVVTAVASLATMIFLLQITPKLRVVPTLNQALAMDAELLSERREKDRVEGQLRETEDRYRLLVDGIRDYAIFLMDTQGVITSWNPGAEKLTGYTADEILGHPVSRLFPPGEVAEGRPQALLRQALADGRVVDEGWRVRKDGRRFLASGVISPFYDGQGGLRGFTKVTRDITTQKAAQTALEDLAESLEDKVQAQIQELQASEARLQGFIRHAPAAIAFKDRAGRFLVINPRMASLIGRPAAEILGKVNEDLFPSDSCAVYQARDQRALALRQAIQEEDLWIDGEGATHYVLSHLFPLVDATGQDWGLGYIGTDITERKQADLALLQSQKLESLGVLAGGIAHDFNNLLGAMQGNVELARTERTLDEAQPFLDNLQGLMDKASGLLRQMLAYSGRGKAKVQTLDLNNLVEDLTLLLGASIPKKVQIRLRLQPELPLMEADLSQIQQVVMNLVLNASEAMGEENGLITIATGQEDLSQEAIDASDEGQTLHPGRHVSLQVADTGAGMTPEVLRKIFDPFFTTKFAGRGLGLAAIHGIVRSHQGGIRVTSESGKGSTFRLLFPAIAGVVAPAAPDPPLPPPPASQGPPGGIVLVVDDEEAMRAVVVLGLDRAGFQSLQAREGQEALTLFEHHRDRIRLVLMDLTMPTMDGEETCRELRRRGASVPIILCSGFNETEAMSRFAGQGLAGFIQKPFALGALLKLVEKVLSG